MSGLAILRLEAWSRGGSSSFLFAVALGLAQLSVSSVASAQSPGQAGPSGQPGDPQAPPPEQHAASQGTSNLPKVEATLPEDPNEIPEDVKGKIGTDRERDDDPQGTNDETDVDFYGVYYGEQSGDYRFRTTLPFPFWLEQTEPGDRSSLYGPYYQRRSENHDADVVFPFVWSFRNYDETTTIVPPFMHQESIGKDGKPGTHANWLPPIFFEGTTDDGGGYFHIPPLLTFTEHSDHDGFNLVGPVFCAWKGGPSCDVRTTDSIDLGVAPFYFYGRDRTSEYELIPPLLHYYSWNDVGESETNLWGPVLYQRDREGEVLDIFPLFWRNWNAKEDHVTLFPFFHYGYDQTSHLLVTPFFVEAEGDQGEDTFVTWGYARYRGRTELDMVTPLFWWYRDPDIGLDTKLLFPFFYKSDSPKHDDLVVFPFFAHFDRPGVSESTWVTPLFEHNTSVTGWYTNIYPIFFMGRDHDETHLVAAPIFWDFASPKSRTTLALPVFFRFADEEGVSQLALNTYYTEKKVRGGTDWQFHFFPALSFGGSPDGHWWNLLYGLAGYTREGTRSVMRTFYIPITLSE